MTERWTHYDDDQLGILLSRAGEPDMFPQTPDLAGRVGECIRPPEPVWYRRFWLAMGARPAVAAGVAAVLLLLISVGIVTSTPNAIADRLGISGIDIKFGPLDTSPAPLGSDLDLGERVSLAEAESAVPYPITLPDHPGLGEPDEVYVGDLGRVQQVSLVFSDRPDVLTVNEDVGLLVTQFPAGLDNAPVGKGMSGQTVVEDVTVNGRRGFWLTGEPHTFAYRDFSGELGQEDVRLASNVLLWETGETVYRIEGASSVDHALAIAESMSEE